MGRSGKEEMAASQYGKEHPDCKCFRALMGPDINVCLPNAPYSCRRSQAEGLCDRDRSCDKCGIYKQFDIGAVRICQKSPKLTKDDPIRLDFRKYKLIGGYKRKKPGKRYKTIHVVGHWRKRITTLSTLEVYEEAYKKAFSKEKSK